MPEARADELVLAKSPSVYHQPDVPALLARHTATLPGVPAILIFRNPIARVVSDIVHYYATYKVGPMPNIDDIIMGRTEPYKYYRGDLHLVYLL